MVLDTALRLSFVLNKEGREDILDHPEQNGVVHVRHALASATERGPEQRRRMVELGAMHVGANDLGEAVVRWWRGIESAEGEVRDVFVDLLRDEVDVEEELQEVGLASEELVRREKAQKKARDVLPHSGCRGESLELFSRPLTAYAPHQQPLRMEPSSSLY